LPPARRRWGAIFDGKKGKHVDDTPAEGSKSKEPQQKHKRGKKGKKPRRKVRAQGHDDDRDEALAVDPALSHLFSEEKPSASHMCIRISLHTYDRRNE
jgi:hypothetical protein